MRKPIIAGNWKMYNTVSQARDLVMALISSLHGVMDVDIVVAPPFTDLAEAGRLTAETNIGLAGQNMHWEEKGAFTGEVSPVMLREIGCRYVIIGHSERRQYFCETNETVNKKLKSALNHKITPIMCVGETLEQREAGQTEQVVGAQIKEGLAGLTPEQMGWVVIAYEPIWAIGTGRTATPEQAQDVHAFIRQQLASQFGQQIADGTRIQYGGSVKPDNVDGLMAKPDIDGALVGGASLKAEDFTRIVKFLPAKH